MKKLTKIKFLFYPLLALLVLGLIYFYYHPKNTESFTVCYSPNNCKTITGVPQSAVQNIIGYPKDKHRENSIIHTDSKIDFEKGRFDEKAFYFTYKDKVYYFINAKIFTGFSEDAGLLPESDAKTFVLIDANFSKDKHHVYGRKDFETPIAYKTIEGADPKTFTPLDWPYAQDKKNVYYLNHKIEGADAETFKILKNKYCGTDKNNYYKDGEIVNKDECLIN